MSIHLVSRFAFVGVLWMGLTGLDRASCSEDNILGCRLTRDILSKASVREKLHRYTGDKPAGWLYKDGTMAGQAIEVLNGPDPDPPVRFGDNLVRFSACRWHSCDEKGAIVLTANGEIVAVGVLHFDVSRHYTRHPMLTILTRDKGDRFREAADHLVAWYEKVTTDYNQMLKEHYGLPDTSDKLRNIRKPEIVLLTESTVPHP